MFDFEGRVWNKKIARGSLLLNISQFLSVEVTVSVPVIPFTVDNCRILHRIHGVFAIVLQVLFHSFLTFTFEKTNHRFLSRINGITKTSLTLPDDQKACTITFWSQLVPHFLQAIRCVADWPEHFLIRSWERYSRKPIKRSLAAHVEINETKIFFFLISQRETILHNINQSILDLQKPCCNTDGDPPTVTLIGENQKLLVQNFSQSLELGDYDKTSEETIVQCNVSKTYPNETSNSIVQTLNNLEVPKTTMENVKQMRAASADDKARLRSLEVTLSSVFDKCTALANACLLKRSKLFVEKNSAGKTTWKKRISWEIDMNLYSRSDHNIFRIHDLKLYYNSILVNVSQDSDALKAELWLPLYSANKKKHQVATLFTYMPSDYPWCPLLDEAKFSPWFFYHTENSICS